MGGLVVRCLGPLQLSLDDRPLILARRPRIVVVVLALSAGRTVPVERLVSAAWYDTNLPRDPRASLQTLISRLRTSLGPGSIETATDGYRLATDPDNVDALRFLRLLRDLPATDTRQVDEALDLWRGEPFTDLNAPWLDRYERPTLVEQYLAAVEHRADLALTSGDATSQLPRLHQLVAGHPLREPLLARLLLTLDQLGRTTEALQRYETARTELAETLGVDPGPHLQDIHAQLLRRTSVDTGRDTPTTAAGSPVPGNPIPRQLPAAINGFVGRAEALDRLDALLPADDTDLAEAAVISAIAGAAGIGKTTLALHWAHHASDRFPDGQLYVNLRGFDPARQVLDPADAIRGFLDALGVPADQIPADLQARTGLYRSVLAGKRVLIVLDNARDAQQVRPLLPGSPGCLALVTSRNQLLGLVASEAVALITVDLLTDTEAKQLLATRIGADRLSAEPDATAEIIQHCARLPLALAIVAARATTYPALPLALLAAHLRQTHNRLDALTSGDPSTDVRAVFSWSYQTLAPDTARLFRLLSLHPGPDIDLAAAASLLGTSRPRTRTALAELCAAHLLAEHLPGRFQVHDLLRAYADELSVIEDSDADRATAVRRVVDYYLHTAQACARVADGYSSIEVPPPTEGASPDTHDDRAATMAWYTAEREVLVRAIRTAFEAGLDLQVCALVQELAMPLRVEARWSLRLMVANLGLRAAVRLGDAVILSRLHRLLIETNLDLDSFDQAHEHARRATELADATGDANEQGHAARLSAYVHQRQGNFVQAEHGFRRALTFYQSAGNERRIATGFNDLGYTAVLAGNGQEAVELSQTALDLQEKLNDPLGAASALDSLGAAHRLLGEPSRSIACYQQAAELLHDAGYPYFEAVVLDRLGDTYDQLGDTRRAWAAWRQAVDLLDPLAHSFGETVRAKLPAQPD